MLKVLPRMLRLIKVGLAIIIVVSVATILITPDSSDDVDGTLQKKGSVEAVLVRVALVLPRPSPRAVSEETPAVLQCSDVGTLSSVQRC